MIEGSTRGWSAASGRRFLNVARPAVAAGRGAAAMGAACCARIVRARVRLTGGVVVGVLVVGVGGVAHAAGPPASGAAIAGVAVGPVVAGSARGAVAAPVGGAGVGEWRLVRGARSDWLVWRSPAPLPFGDARVEIRVQGRDLPLTTVSPDGRTVSVPVPNGWELSSLRASGSLRVVTGARRLDVELRAAAVAEDRAQTRFTVPPALPVDPGTPGRHQTVTGTYTLPGLRIPGYAVPVEVQGVVVSPVGARGARPLVLFLHGRHYTCFGSRGTTSGDWPCPRGMRPVPSDRGYLQVQRLLASQGYDTVSIGANGINAQDHRHMDGGASARSVLVRHHLSLWTRWASPSGRPSAPAIVRRSPLADMSKVLLVGHSRGGEGANRAAIDSRVTPPGHSRATWRIAGLLHLAPTAFGQNPAPGVPTVVVLPYCDGDVSDLQGQQFVDRLRDVAPDGALRSSLLVMGANHNYFNSEWTPGVAVAPALDDWRDRTDAMCRSGGRQRLTPAQQRAVGATYVATAARAFVARDPRVLPLLDGTRVRATSAGRATVLVHSLGGRLTRLVSPGQTGGTSVAPSVAARGGVRAGLCLGYAVHPTSRTGPPVCDTKAPSPHFLSFFSSAPKEATPRAVSAAWTRASGQAVLALPAPASLGRSTAIKLRVTAPPGSAAARFAVRITDVRGRTADLGELTVAGLPRSRWVRFAWAQELRLPLTAKVMRGLDRTRISTVTLIPRSRSGSVVLLDAWGWAPGASAAPGITLPRLDVGRIAVAEGGPGNRTVTVPITVTGASPVPAARVVRVAVLNPRTLTSTSSSVTLRHGQLAIPVPVKVPGNDVDDDDEDLVIVTVQAVSGLTAGDYVNGAVIQDDDPTPTITLISPTTTATEGQTLTWTVTFSKPSNRFFTSYLRPVRPPAGTAELASDDVTAAWLSRWLLDDVDLDPPKALSRLPLTGRVEMEPGQITATLSVPTAADARVEGPEQIWLAADQPDPDDVPTALLPAGTVLTGTVTDRTP